MDPVGRRTLDQRAAEIVGSGAIVLGNLMGASDADIVIEVHWVEWTEPERMLEVRNGRVGAIGVDLEPAQTRSCPSGVFVERYSSFQNDPGHAEISGERVDRAKDSENERVLGGETCGPFGVIERFRLGRLDVLNPIVNRVLRPAPSG